MNHHRIIDLMKSKRKEEGEIETEKLQEQIERRKGFSVCNNMNRSTANEFASPKSAKILSDLNHHQPSHQNLHAPKNFKPKRTKSKRGMKSIIETEKKASVYVSINGERIRLTEIREDPEM